MDLWLDAWIGPDLKATLLDVDEIPENLSPELAGVIDRAKAEILDGTESVAAEIVNRSM